MSRPSYPTDSDIQSLIQASNISIPAFMLSTFTGFASAAQEEWERRTGYRPFLMESTPSTRTFHPPGPNQPKSGLLSLWGGGHVLDFGTGLVNFNSLTIGVSQGNPGTVLLQGTDFWLEPLNAISQSNPYERIRFRAPVFGVQASVVVSGQFGFWSTIAEDAWQAICRLGAVLALDSIAEGLRTSAISWEEDKVREVYDPRNYASLGNTFSEFAEGVLFRYRRMGSSGC